MKIEVKYFNIVQKKLDKKKDEVNLETGSGIYDLLEKLVEINGQKVNKILLDDNGKIKSYIKIYRNNKLLSDYDIKLSDQDTVNIFMAVAGG